MKLTFGEYIRKLRTDNGLTLTQLAAKLGIDSANLSKIETGKRDFDFKRIENLASIFDLDQKQLKDEFLSEQFAKTLYRTNSDTQVLKLTEQKVKYMVHKNSKQGKLKI